MKRFRHVLILSCGAWRSDALGAFPGKSRLRRGGRDFSSEISTPFADRLARQGRLFVGARSTGCYRSLAHASIMTGRPPWEHGIRAQFSERLDPGVPTLAEIFAARGFSTLLASAAPWYFRDSFAGLSRGFARYVDLSPSRADRHLEELGHALGAGLQGRLFAYIHNENLHDYLQDGTVKELAAGLQRGSGVDRSNYLYRHREVFERDDPTEQMSRYVSALAAWDRDFLGPLLEQLRSLGALEQAALILVGDHGEPILPGAPVHDGPGCWLAEESLRVPLILWAPGALESGEDGRLASITDVFATALALAGLEPRGGSSTPWGGMDLLSASSRNAVYAELWASPRGVRLDGELIQRCLRSGKTPVELGLEPDALFQRGLCDGRFKLTRDYFKGEERLCEVSGGWDRPVADADAARPARRKLARLLADAEAADPAAGPRLSV